MEPRKIRVLIAEDNEEGRYLLETLLRGLGYEVVAVRNGAEALENLHVRDFDIIITDIFMPVMDGFQLCMHVKQDDRLRKIPLVFYSAVYTDEQDEDLAVMMGAHKFVRKPVEPGEFARIISEVLAEVGEGKIRSGEPSLEREEILFQRYNERVVNKLEQKVQDLEKEIAKRKKVEEALTKARDELEQRVDERTAELSALNKELAQDIADRKKAEEAADRANQEWERTFNTISHLIMVLDDQHKILRANKAMADALGMTEQELIGRFCFDLVHGEQEPPVFCPHSQLLADGEEHSAEVVEPRLGGIYDVRVSPLVGQNGQVIGSVHVIHDITERKKTEEALRESEERFKQVAECADEWIWEVDADGLYRYCSSAVESILGYSPHELVGQKHFYDLFAPEVREDLKKAALAAFERRASFLAFVNPNVHKKGKIVILETSGTPVLDRDGNFLGYRGADTDITERKMAEAALRESEERHRNLVEHLPQRLFVKDRNWVYVSCNSHYAADLGIVPEQIAGKDDFAFYPSEHAQAYRAADQTCMASGMVEDLEEPYQFAGKERWVHTIKVPYRDWQGRVIGVLGIFEDITERKNMEDSLHRNEERFRSLIDQAADAVFVHDFDGRFVEVNRQACTSLGYTRDELLSMSVNDVDPDAVPRGDSAKFWPNLPATFEARHRRRDGTIFPVEIRLGAIEYGETKVLLAMARDLTDRKKAEEALRTSEERFRLIAETATDVIWCLDNDYRFTYVSPADEKMRGFKAEEVIGQPIFTVIKPSSLETAKEGALRRREDEKQGIKIGTLKHELEVVCKDGRYIWTEAYVTPTRNKDGQISGLVGITRDISERMRADQELRDSEVRFRRLFKLAPLPLCFVNKEGVLTDLNDRFVQMFGYTQDDIPTLKEWWRLAYPDEHHRRRVVDAWESAVKRAAEEKTDIDPVEYKVTCKDGSVCVILASGITIGDNFLATFVDVTERKRAEEALRLEHERFRLSAESLSDVIYEWDLGSSVKWFGNIDRLIGYAPGEFPHTREAWIDILHPEDRDRVLKAVEKQLSDGTIYDIEYRVQHKEGGWRDWLAKGTVAKDASGQPLRWIGAVTDITERKRMEELTLQSTRLRAVADLSSGVAHHFNNLLQIIIGNTSLSLADLESGDLSEVKTSLEKMLQVATLGAELVKRLQVFTNMRADVTERESEVFDIAAIVRNAAEVSRLVWKSDPEKKGINIDLQLDIEGGCLVKGQENEIFEVLVNLVKNAAEAMLSGGDIEVKTYRKADEVVVTVRDTGTGIAEEDILKVFQPFWSSKGVGIGKGMGLAVTHGLVKRHGGDISVQSKVGAGTTFTIRLPLVEEPVRKTVEPVKRVATDNLTILVIDDDEDVAALVGRICTKAGHTVFRAFSGAEGLAIFSKETVDLVISDLGMPGMNGWDVGKAIGSLCSEKGITKPPFILLTGWGGQELEKEKIAESGVDAVVAKPIDRATVLATVREIAARFRIGDHVP